METTVQKNQVYAFRTLGTKKGDPNTYLIQAVDQPNSPVYETPKLKEYALSTPPVRVYCRLCKDGARQSGWRQDWKYTLDLLFPEDRPYDFKVVEVLAPAESGKCRFVVMRAGYNFQLNTKHDLSLREGQMISCRVLKQETCEHYWYAELLTCFPQSEAVQPEALFASLGYDREAYNRYYLNAERSLGVQTVWSRQQLDKARLLEKCNNPHFLLKYIDYLSVQLPQTSNDRFDFYPAWKLLLDLLEFVLADTNDFLLTTCTTAYANTIFKTYSKLRSKAKAIVKAAELCDAGEADYFLTEYLQDFTELDKAENVFRTSVVGQILSMDRNFGIRNSSNVLHLIRLNRKYRGVCGAGYSDFLYLGLYRSYQFWCSRHMQDEILDNRVIDTMLFGYCVLINDVIKQHATKAYFPVDVRQLYAEMVRLLCRRLDKRMALDLLNHTVRLLASGKSPSVIDYASVRMVDKFPNYLAHSLIHNVQPTADEVHFTDHKAFIAYHDNALMIGNLPTSCPVMDLDKRMSYRMIPGTALGIADLTGSLPKAVEGTFKEWRDYWTKVLRTLPKRPTRSIPFGTEVLVRTFACNSNEKVALGLVASTEYPVTGGIRNGGYIKGAYLTNLAEIFDKESYLLRASTMTDPYGHLSFNVSKEIADYSCRRASEVDASALAVCIGNNRLTGWSTFVTESGVVAMAKSPMIAIIGRTYAIRLNPDCRHDGFPTATVDRWMDQKLDAVSLLRKQLRAISDRNLAALQAKGHSLCRWNRLTVPMFLLNEYLRLIDDPVAKYMLLQVLRLYSLQSNQGDDTLGAEIQYREAEACLKEGCSFKTSLPDYEWPTALREGLRGRDFVEMVSRCNNEVCLSSWTVDQWNAFSQVAF